MTLEAGGVEVSGAPPGRIREPIPVGPFLEFCSRRVVQIRRELDSYPKITLTGRHGKPPGIDATARLVMSFGWDANHGVRKLNRWAHPEQGDGHSGYVDRAEIEDALRNVGVDIADVYPALPQAKSGPVRMGQHRRMTDAQVIAAHTVYVKGRMTMMTLGELIYQRFGYASVSACARSLAVAFRGLGMPLRQCAGTTRFGRRCQLPPMSACDFCQEHDLRAIRPSQIGAAARVKQQAQRAWIPSAETLALARQLHVDQGLSWREVARQIAPIVNRCERHVACLLSTIAAREGWHRTTKGAA